MTVVDNESVHALTGAYVLDALVGDELAAFERHLSVCADCREEVASLGTAALRLSALTQTAPPPELRSSVLAAIRTVRPLPPLPRTAPTPATADDDPTSPEPTTPEPVRPTDVGRPVDLASARHRRSARSSRWRLAAAAAAVVALGGVTWGIVQPAAAPDRESVAIQQADEAQFDALMSAPDLEVFSADEAGIEGTVLRSEVLGTAALVMRGEVPDLTTDQVFQAWTLVGAAPVSAGVFEHENGTMTVMLEGDVASADAVAVTVEPIGGSEAPTTVPFLQVVTA